MKNICKTKSSQIGIVSGEDPSMLKSAESGEQQMNNIWIGRVSAQNYLTYAAHLPPFYKWFWYNRRAHGPTFYDAKLLDHNHEVNGSFIPTDDRDT